MSAGDSRKPLGGGCSAPNPAGELTALPDSLAGGEGLLPLPKNRTPALGLRS